MKRSITISSTLKKGFIHLTNSVESVSRYGGQPVTNSHKIKTSEIELFDACFNKNLPTLLPHNTVWTSGDKRSLIVMEDPRRRVLSFRNGAKKNYGIQVQEYELPMPPIYYGISPDQNLNPYVSHVLSSRAPVTNRFADFDVPPIPNLFNTSRVCTHDLLDPEVKLPYHLAVNAAIEEFWGSVFNMDVGHVSSNPTYQYMLAESSETMDKNLYKNVWAHWEKFEDDWFVQRNYQWHRLAVGKIVEDLMSMNPYYSFGTDIVSMMMNELYINAMQHSVD